jgi:hypothetical protein
VNIIVKTTLEQAIEDLKMIASPDTKNFELNQLLSDDIEIVLNEIERLNNIINDMKKFLKEYSQDLEFRCYADYFLNKLLELCKGE